KMRIENDIKLGYKDVMIRPKRSTLKSRAEVDLSRIFTFRNSQKNWSGLPMIAANMDTDGTFEMHNELAIEGLVTASHKHYPHQRLDHFRGTPPEGNYEHSAVSTGTGKEDEEKVKTIFQNHPRLEFLCIDVANGYSEYFVEFVQKMRHN